MINFKKSLLSQLPELTEQLNLTKRPENIDIVRYAAQNHFICFCLAVMPKFIPTRFHQLLADELQLIYENIRDGKDERRVFEMQPQLGKSTMVSELFPAWVLGKTDWPIICASYGAALAERKSENCRAIVDSDVYKFIFPKVRLSKESTSREFWRTTKGGTYRAVGVGGALTGMSGKILICLPYNQKITTDAGEIPIGDIVTQKMPVKVLSFNHDTGLSEFKEIEEYEDNPGREILEITLDDGTVIECTEDHPVFIEGKGYVNASDVQEGDISLVL